MGTSKSRFLNHNDMNPPQRKDSSYDKSNIVYYKGEELTASNDLNPPHRKDPSYGKPNIVYYKGEELTASILRERTEVVTEIIVCKTSLIDHWYVKVVLGAKHEQPLEIHYFDTSSVIVQSLKADSPKPVRETRYAPTLHIRLSHILQVCLDFAEVRPYSFFSYNCQDFVIAIANRFTDRSTLSLFFLPVSQKISRACAKTKTMALEKEFLIRCQNFGTNLALQILQQTNAEIKEEIDRRALEGQVGGPEIEDFVKLVLTPEIGEYRASDFQNFLKKQDDTTVEVIRENMMQSWRLASFVVFLEESQWQDRRDILPPHKALNQYQTYHF